MDINVASSLQDLTSLAIAAAAPGAPGHEVSGAINAFVTKMDGFLTGLEPRRNAKAYVAAAAPLMNLFARAGPPAAHLDELVYVTPMVPCSTAAMLVLLRLRLDLVQHEVEWRTPEAQVRISDLLPGSGAEENDEDTVRKYFDPVMRGIDEPIIFWGVRRTMSLLAVLARLWTEEDGARFDLVNMVLWASRRLALLLSFEFPASTLDVEEYRRGTDGSAPVGEPMFAASTALLWDVAARLRPMFRDIDRAHAHGYPEEQITGAVGVEDARALAEAHVRRCVYRMHGDKLPSMFARCTIARAARFGNDALYERLCGGPRMDKAAPRPLDILRLCCGEGYAQQVHDRSERSLRDVVAAGTGDGDEALLEACCEYYANQRKIEWEGAIKWVPLACRWSTYKKGTGNARMSFATYTEAFGHFVSTRWPASAMSSAKKKVRVQ